MSVAAKLAQVELTAEQVFGRVDRLAAGIDPEIPVAIVERLPPPGWMRAAVAALAAPPDGRPPDALCTIGNRQVKGWTVRVDGVRVVVLDRRTEQAVEAEYRRRADDLRSGRAR